MWDIDFGKRGKCHFRFFRGNFSERGEGGGRGRGKGKIGFEKEDKSLNAVSRSQQQLGRIEITINLFGFWVKVNSTNNFIVYIVYLLFLIFSPTGTLL